jgi:rfaE bifunctional protein kinase chain/domain
MKAARFDLLARRYSDLSIAVVGDVCLDRYLEIDPALAETSIETGLTVHNVVNVRSQPGAAGTIMSNLIALGVGEIHAIGFCGRDGEGYELERAMYATKRLSMDGFIQTPLRRTFTYTKPLVRGMGKAPRELSRLDLKNWTPTPAEVEKKLIGAIEAISEKVDTIIVMDQVDVAETGVVTTGVRTALAEVATRRPALPVLADCRRGLRDWPPFIFKMNRQELGTLLGRDLQDVSTVPDAALDLARRNRRSIFITLAEHGMIGADPGGEGIADDAVTHRAAALPTRGEIDVVGAGDSVSANLGAALAAGANVAEAVTLANAAASLVIHQVGTTGVATIEELRGLAVE